MKTLPSTNERSGERSDVAAFELLPQALIGIALKSLEVAGGQVSLPQFRLLLTLDRLGPMPSSKLANADHAAAVRAASQFASLSGNAIAVGESGPVPL